MIKFHGLLVDGDHLPCAVLNKRVVELLKSTLT